MKEGAFFYLLKGRVGAVSLPLSKHEHPYITHTPNTLAEEIMKGTLA